MRRSVLWAGLVVVGWWTLYALFYAGQMMSAEGAGGKTLPAERALAHAFGSACVWVPISLALLAFVVRFPLERGKVLPRLSLFALFTAAAVVARVLLAVALNPLVGWYEVLPPLSSLLVIKALNTPLLLWLMIGVAHAWWYARRVAERERQAQLQARLVEARLEALSAQLDPTSCSIP